VTDCHLVFAQAGAAIKAHEVTASQNGAQPFRTSGPADLT
jgi:hypothetical protein